MQKVYSSKWTSKLVEVLQHPLTRGLSVDDPQTTARRRQIIQEKKFLRSVYKKWYMTLKETLPSGSGGVVEIGSGAGFLSDFIPDLITSDLFYNQWTTLVLDGRCLPFADESLRAIVMIDVLHHLSKVRSFLSNAARCIREGGVISMVEPWVNPWSKIIFRNFIEEPFYPESKTWEFMESGPLSGANLALPWILFERDRDLFEHQFPQWRIQRLNPIMPFSYLLSGGVSLRSLMPAWTFSFWHTIDEALTRLTSMALFAIIVLVRTNLQADR
jgi:SAM-dependent methyltransferase